MCIRDRVMTITTEVGMVMYDDKVLDLQCNLQATPSSSCVIWGNTMMTRFYRLHHPDTMMTRFYRLQFVGYKLETRPTVACRCRGIIEDYPLHQANICKFG